MILQTIFKLLFPHVCLNCRRLTERDEVLCPDCRGLIRLNQTLFCGRCRARVPGLKKICHEETPFLLGAAAEYAAAPVKNLVRGLKFEFIKNAGVLLGNLLADYAESIPGFRDRIAGRQARTVVLPIPLSGRRLRERGFNQSELIARTFAARFSIALDASIIARKKNTKPQSEMRGRDERLANVADCFEVENPHALRRAPEVILIDDVITSGATIESAARALKSSGARSIFALAASKA